MKLNRGWATLAAVGFVATGCSSSSSSNEVAPSTSAAARGEEVQNGPPIDLPITRQDVPSTGLCRVFVVDFSRIASSNDFGCNNIEHSVQLGSFIMFRSRENRNEAYLCRMSNDLPGVIDGIDVYNIARMNLVRVVMPRQRRTAANSMRCAEAEGL